MEAFTKQVKSCSKDTLNVTAGAITIFEIVDVQLLLSVTRMVCVPGVTLANENVVNAELIEALLSNLYVNGPTPPLTLTTRVAGSATV